MQIIEAIILFCNVSFAIASFSEQCWYEVYLLNETQNVSNIRRSCLCPPLYGYHVSDHLNKGNSDLERVVVYYYIDRTNNNMYMFIPNREKQLSIPELDLDHNDNLRRLSDDFVVTLIDSAASSNSNPNKKIKPKKKTNKTPNSWNQTSNYPKPNRTNHDGITNNYPQKKPKTVVKGKLSQTQSKEKPLKPTNPYEYDDDDDIDKSTNLIQKDKILKPGKTHENHKNTNKVNNRDEPHFNDFDSWYDDQIIEFPELQSGDPQYITYKKLKKQIRHVFSTNKHSKYQDFYRSEKDMTFDNYRLIRVNIREQDDEPALSSDVDGVMLVRLTPLTILEVIPLKNTFDDEEIEESNDDINASDENYPINYDLWNTNTTGANPSNTGGKFNNIFANLGDAFKKFVSRPPILEATRRDSGEEVVPGFRIIGGNAATGSGTPINSRGRSASPDIDTI